MQFNSYIFILVFLPLLIIGYFGLNKINIFWGKLYIIAASALFYIYGGYGIAIILGISIISNYFFALLIGKLKPKTYSKLILIISITSNITMLFYFKYFDFFISTMNLLFKTDFTVRNILLPLGVSFFTFQQIMYLVNIYNGTIERIDVFDYLAYILYFPKLISGPLIEPTELIQQINNIETKYINWDNMSCGIKILSLGLFKKLILADTFASAVNWGYTNIETVTPMGWLLIMLSYTFEIYFDFSGYSDMAVGISTMLNITLPINFDSPYKAISIREFWRRWHITLTDFLTKYVYIPLGGSHKGKIRTYINTLLVFCVSGIWHGANWTFVLWGILHGLLSVFERISEKVQKKIFKPLKWMCTFSAINVLWLLFRSDSVSQWIYILKVILKLESRSVNTDFLTRFSLPEFTFINKVFYPGSMYVQKRTFGFFIFIIGSFFICLILENNYKTLTKNNWKYMIVSAVAFIWGFLYLSAESVFVYSNF